MDNILGQAKRKRAEMVSLINKLIEYYGDRSTFLFKKARRLRCWTLGCTVVGLTMLAAFIVVGGSDFRWLVFGMASVAFTGVGAVVISFYEKHQQSGFECVERISELAELSDSIPQDSLTLGNAYAMRRYYVALISILNCEYLDGESRWGSPSVPIYDPFNAASSTEKANVLLDTIDDIAEAVVVGNVVGDAVSLVADGISDVLSGLAD
jgi:hypothetical protein